MKRLPIAVLCLFISLLSPASAEEPGLAAVSDEKIRRLESLHGQAEELILKNDFRAAIAVYDEILLEEPDDETAYTGMAQCQLILGDFDRAKASYQNALHINPDNETAQMGLQKIEDPDSMNFTETSTVTVPDAEPAPSAVPAAARVASPAAPAPRLRETSSAFSSPAAQMPATVDMPIHEMPMHAMPTQTPAAEPLDDVQLGARKTMAPYSVDIPEPVRHLTRGHKIQAALKNAGFYTGPIDGIVGAGTRKATRLFQERYDLEVDGKVGPKTWELLQPFLNPNDLKEDILKKGAREGH